MTRISLVMLSLVALLWACGGDNFTPKPRGYFRIDLPKKEYQRFDSTYPYTFCRLKVTF